ncbi:MAG: hypothetical protein ACP5GJ_03570, partial [Nanopusillaceae archaeon]
MDRKILAMIPLMGVLAAVPIFSQGLQAQLVGIYNIPPVGTNSLVISNGYVNLPFMTSNGTLVVKTKHGNFNIVFHGEMTVTENGTNETVVEFIHENRVTYISMVVYENMTGITEKFIEHYVNTYGVNLTQNITIEPVDNDTFELETTENATAMLLGFIPKHVVIGEQMYVNATNGDIEQTVDIRPWWWWLIFG